jgi:uncharacterized protein
MSHTDTPACFEVFEDTDGQWRWRYVDEGGSLLANSNEPYPSKQKALQDLHIVQSNASSTPVTFLPEPIEH